MFDVEIRTNVNANANVTKIKTLHVNCQSSWMRQHSRMQDTLRHMAAFADVPSLHYRVTLRYVKVSCRVVCLHLRNVKKTVFSHSTTRQF